MSKIVIVGAGFTGIQLAKRLINEDNDVVLIDNDEDIVRHASNRLNCTVLLKDGNSLETLEEVGISKSDALVAVTESDEINMITCSLVDAVYPDLLKIARVRNYDYYVNTENVTSSHKETFTGAHRPLYGIDHMIHPDVEAAQAIVTAVEHGAVSDVVSFENDYEFTRLKIERGSKMDGIAVKAVRQLTNCLFTITYAENQDGSFIPSGDSILHAGDFVGVLSKKNDIPSIMELFGTKIEQLKKIAIIGAGRVGMILAENFMKKRKTFHIQDILLGKKNSSIAKDLVIIDPDDVLCKEAEEMFPGAKIFCADITDESFIQEEGIDKFDLVICATGNLELNMVASAYLESLGVDKTISLVSSSTFGGIAHKLGVDVVIPMNDTVVDSIMSHLRGKTVTGIHTISGGNFEIVECDLISSSKIVGKSLKEIARPGEFLVMLVKKPGAVQYEIPVGNTIFTVGDHLVLIEKTGDKKILEKFSGTK